MFAQFCIATIGFPPPISNSKYDGLVDWVSIPDMNVKQGHCRPFRGHSNSTLQKISLDLWKWDFSQMNPNIYRVSSFSAWS